jgi:hypothetical protein
MFVSNKKCIQKKTTTTTINEDEDNVRGRGGECALYNRDVKDYY